MFIQIFILLILAYSFFVFILSDNLKIISRRIYLYIQKQALRVVL